MVVFCYCVPDNELHACALQYGLSQRSIAFYAWRKLNARNRRGLIWIYRRKRQGRKSHMYQNFNDIGGPAHSAERLASFRAILKRLSLTGFVLPRSDEFQNEFV